MKEVFNDGNRHKKKITELYQGKTLTKIEQIKILVLSAILLCFIVTLYVEFFKHETTFFSYNVFIGIIISVINIVAWGFFIEAISNEKNSKKNALLFLTNKTLVVLISAIIVIFKNKEILISAFIGFSAHLILTILLLTILNVYKISKLEN